MPSRAPNATPTNPNPEELVSAVVLPNQGRGFGHGVTSNLQSPEGYDRTINMTCADGRVLSPSFAATINNSIVSRYPPAFIVGWQDTSTPAVPIALAGFDTGVYLVKNNSVAVESLGAIPASRIFSAAFHDNGSAGVAHLYIGVDPTTGYLRRRTQAGVWTEASGAGQLVRAKYITSSAGKLWATINDFQIRSCPSGSEPFTLLNWTNSIWVGTAEAKITSIGHIANVVIVGKENGIWAFNEADNRYEPIYRERFDPDNFPFMEPDGQGGLFTTNAEGKVIRIQQFGNVAAATPLKDKFIGRDTPRGRITSMAIFGDRVMATMDRGVRFTGAAGLTVLETTDGGTTFTDFTAAMTDGRVDIGMDISGLSTTNYVLIGADVPFIGIEWVLTTASTATADVTLVAYNQNGVSNISLIRLVDLTDTTASTASTPWGQTGAMVFSQTQNIPLSPQANVWTAVTLQGYTKFWIRTLVT